MTAAINRVSLYRGEQRTAPVGWGYLPRSTAVPASFAVPTAISGISYGAGGIPIITDVAFVLLAVLCVVWLADDVLRFQRRFGIGGLLLFGGTLLWFCNDYLSTWLGIEFDASVPYDPDVIAKATFFHCLFVMIMTMGLQLSRGNWAVNLLQIVPEPNSRNFYFILVVVLCMVGFIPMMFFSTDSFLNTVWGTIVSGRGARGFKLTMGRSGALNYNWGGYILELIKVGRIGAVLAVVYALLVPDATWKKIVAWCIWGIWMLMAFGGGNRGHVAVIGLPAIFLMFLKFQSNAAAKNKKISVMAYVGTAVIAIISLYMVQIQAEHRNRGFRNIDITETNLTSLKGNRMFSEGLTAWRMIPVEAPFISNNWLGEGLIRAIPETTFYMVIHPIPRALWHNKPIDPLWAWYNSVTTDKGSAGTTVSKGLVGSWYFRFGALGMIQGALLVGWLMRMAERALQEAQGRVMVVLSCLTFITWLFRCFRDFAIPEFWEFAVALIFVYVTVRVYNVIFPRTLALQHA